MRLRYHGVPWIRPAVDQTVKKFFMKYGKLRNYRKGEMIFKGKEFYPYLSLIVSGIVSKYCENILMQKTTKDKAISVIFHNSMIGDSFFLSDRTSNVSATAIRDCVFLEVPHETAWDYMFSNNDFNKKMIYSLMYDIESDLEGFANIVARTPKDRMFCFFKGLINRFEVGIENGWYRLPVDFTHSEIAQIIYTTPLTVNRLLLELKREGNYKKVKKVRFIRKNVLDNLYDWEDSDGNDSVFIDSKVYRIS
ncbi:putative transcriptional regulator, Crp/Fnr family [Denitrovibrio acetiphilus DSM 12809]|uniref:Putative transcriptional regulator, Crp/Fnr family n=2 Tax=Denitrovibrio TaxID=117999 RepID=D4H262_DENA2|nr:putative transcriptional regulator, Crp/Fnr family [Denitrovibrio acetiphilus DSM 12809]